MSVKQCDREGCQNIMCDRMLLNNRYYICEECFQELKEYINSRLHETVKVFMNTDKFSDYNLLKELEIDDNY